MRHELMDYATFEGKFPDLNFHLVCMVNKTMTDLKNDAPDIAENIEKVLEGKGDKMWGEYLPSHYHEFYEAYKVLHKKDPTDKFLSETELFEDS